MIDATDRRYGPLEALSVYYRRMTDAETPGWSREKFGWCVVIDGNGEPVDCLDLRDTTGKKPIPTLRVVPASFPRPGIKPQAFFLWDKTAFSLGVTKAGQGGWKIAKPQHDAFVHLHAERLADSDDVGLVAFRRFLECWTPDRFERPPFKPEMLDGNVMFRLDADVSMFLHERPAARHLVETSSEMAEGSGFCLATGARSSLARLHPAIKGVEGAQSSGASLVSFNQEAFESYGKQQGENAPTSTLAAFQYGTALNRLLARDSRNRLRRKIGDATIVFWADASNTTAAEAANTWFRDAFSGEVEDEEEARKIGEELDRVATGVPLSELRSRIEPGTRFHVLGLAPNAARLSIRYWLSDSVDVLAGRLAAHHHHVRIEPAPWKRPPAVNYLLAQTTALQAKFDNIPPLLAGEVTRAILTGGLYPRSWLAAVITRLRSGDDPALGWHAAAIKAVLTRQRENLTALQKEEPPPMSLDRDHPNIGYQLGRLFALYELLQRAALGRNINATIRDKYFSAASAAPASTFPLIISNAQSHMARVRKDRKGWSVVLERELEDVIDRITPTMPRSLPRSLRLEDQGEFAIGYYHQRATRLGGNAIDQPTIDENSHDHVDNNE
jgi:CRISPR-associated protein Csd1